MATSVDTVDGKGSRHMDPTIASDEVKTLITVLKGQVFLLGKDWDNLLDPEKKELAESAVVTVTELNDLVRGKAEEGEEVPNLRVIG